MNSRILIFAHVPPPVHGQSVMVKQLMEGLRDSGQLNLRDGSTQDSPSSASIAYCHINPQLSEGLDDIGRWQPRKLLLTFGFIFQAIRARFKHRLDTFYFVPAPPDRKSIYRDWCVLFFCRPFFHRLIFHWHCNGQPEFIEKKMNALERVLCRWLYGNAALSIVLSNYSRDEASYFSSRRTVVVPNGIPDPCPDFDTEVWPERQRRAGILATAASGQMPSPLFYEVLFLSGRMTPKGLFDAMATTTKANQLLAEKNLPLRMRLTVAGDFADASERNRYEAAAQELNATSLPGSGSLAIYEGWADDAKKRLLYRRADCFIFPTTYPAESFGLVLAEAMAHGCTVITTRWQAVPEVLPGGYENLVEPHDIEAMAEALLRCTNAQADRSLRDYFLARFTSQRFVEEMITVLGNP